MIVKRTVDVVGSAVLLVLLSPVLVLIACAVRLRMGRPILFAQERPGWKEQPFMMLKFRTMADHRDGRGGVLADRDRLSPLGLRLRSWSLDELPQLLNIFVGHMSFIGPRPLLTRYSRFLSDEERLRFRMRPGVTGWAQVNGRNTTSWDERLACDVWYVRNWSLTLDLQIALKTVGVIVTRNGFVADPEARMANLDVERGMVRPNP
ncbi:MAG: sugar transferase [Candidatus Dormibacteria bacterium]